MAAGCQRQMVSKINPSFGKTCRYPIFTIRHNVSIFSSYLKRWIYKVCLPAARTAAGTGKAPAVFEHIAATEAFAGPDAKFISLCRQRPGDVSQVLINFLFLDSNPPRQFPGIHLPLSQQRDDLLADCWHSLGLRMIIADC